jgi:hypothetical protein
MDRPSPATRNQASQRSPNRLNAVDWWILGIVVLALFGGRTLYCATGDSAFQSCMRQGMPRVIGMSLQAAALIFAIWVGPMIGRRFESRVLGLVSGATVFIAISALLLWLGLLPT